jgi:hypothetical protein
MPPQDDKQIDAEQKNNQHMGKTHFPFLLNLVLLFNMRRLKIALHDFLDSC